MQTVLTAPEIVCDGCANAIKKALAKVPGVSGVEVNIATKSVTITQDRSIERHTLAEAIERAGFEVAP